MEYQGPQGAQPPAGATPPAAGAPRQALLLPVLQETPDVILMLQLNPTGTLTCQTAISSIPTTPSLAALNGASIEAILPADVLQRFGARYGEARERQGPIRYEERVGDVILDVALTPIMEGGGEPSHLFWSARNITDQWRAAESLRSAEERLRALEQEREQITQASGDADAQSEAAQEALDAIQAEREALEARAREMEERAKTLESEAAQREGLAERTKELEESISGIEHTRELLEQQTRTLFDDASIGFAWTDTEGTILEANRALVGMIGRAEDDVVGSAIAELVHEEEKPEIERLIAEVLGGDRPTGQTDARIPHEEGEYSYVQLQVSGVGGEGAPERLLWQANDLTERRGLQERLAHQALHDSLTGLPNRALFLDRLGRAITRLDRNPGTVAVMVLDLDRFDAVNETHGHEIGDLCLRQLGERLEQKIRQADTVAHISSDEFAFVYEDLQNEEDVEPVAARIREAVEEPLTVEGATLTLSGSIGVALTTSHTDRPESILRDAGMAVHKAKSDGRGGTVIFDESMRAESAKRLRTEADLHRAIEEGEFRLFYQPQVSLETGRIVGAEVLARWQHPDRGLVTPSEFIALAEETGLIVPLGTWVFTEACEQSQRWGSAREEPLLTWVNVSPRQLTEPKFTDTVEKVLAETGADPSTMCLEVTEGVLVEESSSAIATLRALKDLGLKIGIDDFGKGFSSLSYLKRLPVDMLKLDRTFVAGLGQSEEDQAIAAAVINLARAIGLTSMGEGVETPEQLAILRELGCELAQGYFFSSPQPPEVLAELLSQDLRW